VNHNLDQSGPRGQFAPAHIQPFKKKEENPDVRFLYGTQFASK